MSDKSSIFNKDIADSITKDGKKAMMRDANKNLPLNQYILPIKLLTKEKLTDVEITHITNSLVGSINGIKCMMGGEIMLYDFMDMKRLEKFIKEGRKNEAMSNNGKWPI